MSRIRTIALLWTITLAACLGAGTDGHQEQQDAGDSGDDANTASPDALPDGYVDASCEMACGEVCCASDQICCTDQHGHFPQCVSGDACP